MARLTNKALAKQGTNTGRNGKKGNAPRAAEGKFDSSECHFQNRKERVKVQPSNPVNLPEIEYPSYTARAGGYIEYQMPTAMAQNILDERTGKDASRDPQKYLCDYVNEQYGLLGYCVRVVLN